MRLLGCTVMVLGLLASLPPLAAQQRSYPGVALLDLRAVLEQHPGFQAMKKELQGFADMIQVDIRARRERVAKLIEQLKQLKPGSPEYKNLEAQITKERADLNVYISLKRKELLERETKMYYTAYAEVRQIVAQICRQYGIGIVLRFENKPLDPNNSQNVLAHLNNRVFYHEKSLDLTPLVIQQIRQRRAQTSVGARRGYLPPGVPRPR